MSLAATTALILTSSILTVLAAFHWLRPAPAPAPGHRKLSVKNSGMVYLFEGRKLLDATERASSLLPPGQQGLDDFGRFLAVFGPRFPGLEERLSTLAPDIPVTLDDPSGDPHGLSLTAEYHDGVTRLALVDPGESDSNQRLERYALQAMEIELGTLRSIAEQSPILTWKQRADGTVIWANAAYMDMIRHDYGEGDLSTWPPRRLFDCIEATRSDDPRRLHRPSQRTGVPEWFEVSGHAVGDAVLSFAVPIDGTVRAETMLKAFIGTLGKTFAQLPIGLAIFDAGRRLVLFNPALVDLTGLDAAALSQQPNLHTFLDALRENQRIPEPRDYKSWRLRIARLEAEATDGRYQETWTLPNGQTYRVTGQPHPDGAVAFLFEDITSEVSLKRQFRSELDTGQSVLDAMPQAMAVLDAEGCLTVVNAAFRDLWDLDPANSPARIPVDAVLAALAMTAPEPPGFAQLRDFVRARRPRMAFRFELPIASEPEPAHVIVRPLPHRATLIELHLASEIRTLPHVSELAAATLPEEASERPAAQAV